MKKCILSVAYKYKFLKSVVLLWVERTEQGRDRLKSKFFQILMVISIFDKERVNSGTRYFVSHF